MSNFNNALTSKIISLIIAVSFLLTDISYAGAYQQGSLRVPVGEELTYERAKEVMRMRGGTQSSVAAAGVSTAQPADLILLHAKLSQVKDMIRPAFEDSEAKIVFKALEESLLTYGLHHETMVKRFEAEDDFLLLDAGYFIQRIRQGNLSFEHAVRAMECLCANKMISTKVLNIFLGHIKKLQKEKVDELMQVTSRNPIIRVFKSISETGLTITGKNQQQYTVKATVMDAAYYLKEKDRLPQPELDLYGHTVDYPVRIKLTYFDQQGKEIGVSFFVTDPFDHTILFSKGTGIGAPSQQSQTNDESGAQNRQQGLRSAVLDWLRNNLPEGMVLWTSIGNDTTLLQINELLLEKRDATLSLELKQKIKQLCMRYQQMDIPKYRKSAGTRFLDERAVIGELEVLSPEDSMQLARNILEAYDNEANYLSSEELARTFVGALGKHFGPDQKIIPKINPEGKEQDVTIIHVIPKGGNTSTPAAAHSLRMLGSGARDSI